MTFLTYIPQNPSTSMVLSAPHCGIDFPDEFLLQSPLSREKLLETADIGTDFLIDSFSEVATIKAIFARSFVDLNRARTQIDKSVIIDIETHQDLQTLSGYGVIPRFARYGLLTHSKKILMEHAQMRLRQYYDPYHVALKAILDQNVHKFGEALLLDIHSAPAHILKEVDVQIGTLHGKTCRHEIVKNICASFQKNGLKVGLETPFSGGHITRSYAMQNGVQSIQIEVNRKHCVNDFNKPILDYNRKFVQAWQQSIHGFLKSNE